MVGRGIALLFHDRGTRRGWVVSSTPRPHFTPRKDPIPILQEAGWAPGPVWTEEILVPTGIRSRTVQSVAQSLYRLSYRAHKHLDVFSWNLLQRSLAEFVESAQVLWKIGPKHWYIFQGVNENLRELCRFGWKSGIADLRMIPLIKREVRKNRHSKIRCFA